MIKRVINYEISNEYRGLRVSAFLKRQGYPENALTILRSEEGNLLINGLPIYMNYVLLTEKDQETLSVVIKENGSSEKIPPIQMPLNIVYEDEDLLVVNKPPLMPIHPSLNNYENTLANAISFYFSQKNEPFVFRCINRLDRDTTGLTILAKHYLSAGILSKDMLNRDIKREYTAIVEGRFTDSDGTIDMPIGRKDQSLITREIDFENGERAITHYHVVSYNPSNNLSLVKLVLETGRTHQIRVHMKAIGHPLIGDFLYNPENTLINRQALHAGKIEFTHPVSKERMIFETPLPDDMRSFI